MVTKNDQQKGHNILATFKQHRNKKQRNKKTIKKNESYGWADGN